MTQSKAVQAGAPDLEGTERERIIRKIKRCLALGESANQNEAEMAMRQAQAMMRSYRLSEADIHAESVGCETRAPGLIRPASWQQRLAHMSAQAFGCEMLTKVRKVGPVEFMFIGVMPAAELAAYAYDTLLTQITVARKQFQKAHKAGRGVANDFCEAWIYAVDQKLKNFAQGNPVQNTEANALVLVQKRETAAIDAWLAREKWKVKTKNDRIRGGYDPTAIHMGKESGSKANINQAVRGARGDAPMIE